jgi:DNA-binding CsgD family transcriptional regulator
VTSRIIVDRVLLEQPDGEQAIRALIGTGPGADVRIGSRLGASMWIIDGAEVVIGPLTGSGGDAAYIHSPQVAVALCQLFELLWKESVTMCRPSPHERLTPTQWRILQLLALGFDDPTLARITGTTVKTVRTHITAVLTALGAPTRFAAGAAAATRGWLS